jgi:hypothetical protein
VAIHRHAADGVGQRPCVDQHDRVLVLVHLDLCGPAEHPCRDIDANPTASQACDDTSQLLGTDACVRQNTFRLPKNDKRCSGMPDSDVKPSDKIRAAVTTAPGDPPFLEL